MEASNRLITLIKRSTQGNLIFVVTKKNKETSENFIDGLLEQIRNEDIGEKAVATELAVQEQQEEAEKQQMETKT
eukprot:7546033-Ditylum_brightwellii.AAC.1